MNIELYKTTPLEESIYSRYQANGIHTVEDLHMGNVATILGGDIAYTQTRSHARWIDDETNYFVVFLNPSQDIRKQRYDFFHEIAHPLNHVGDQRMVSPLFNHYQEIQAEQFQLYAALPFYMVVDYKDVPESVLSKILAQEFILPESLVIKRIEQIKRRIMQEYYHEELVKKMVSNRRKADTSNWSSETKSLVKLALTRKQQKELICK
ncbi:ImmA/IrrE family metallo-endopeptidase [Alkalihalobacterium alkalinitrilicum]|uniref:ImmA/IrrE family metallo-endopeptidase n=1 Tax=Alkalihalobacterium alkalinitrilicum TaxID=427920 RepID=UPI000994AE0A|nr:ImmA/IrrE family metallo-endopeptidase [Alkalihalobacterium alkalinitrilicum]